MKKRDHLHKFDDKADKDKDRFQYRKLIPAYLSKHRKGILFFCLFFLLYAVVFSLYNLPAEAVAYAALLCVCAGAVLITADFIRFCSRHKQLRMLMMNILLDRSGLPFPKDILEQDYQDIIKLIWDDRMRIESAADSIRSDMLDYYTLWVHQIKTPISAMDLLLQSEESALNRELRIELIKIQQYVEFVLQYLRLDSMSSDLVLKHVELDSIVKQAVRKYSRMFILKKIRLNYEPFQCQVLTDEKWLTFVVEQLLTNALKYTKEGTISIYLEPSHGNTLVIEDTGIGIDAQDLPRVFERGYTGYNGRSDKKSTGLGLYLCKQILNRLSHSITIESTVGKGTRVLIGLTANYVTPE